MRKTRIIESTEGESLLTRSMDCKKGDVLRGVPQESRIGGQVSLLFETKVKL